MPRFDFAPEPFHASAEPRTQRPAAREVGFGLRQFIEQQVDDAAIVISLAKLRIESVAIPSRNH